MPPLPTNPKQPRSIKQARQDAQFHATQLVNSLQDAGADTETIDQAEELFQEVKKDK